VHSLVSGSSAATSRRGATLVGDTAPALPAWWCCAALLRATIAPSARR